MKKICIILVLFFIITEQHTFAQWVSCSNGLYSGRVNTLAKCGTNIFAGTNGGGVYLSTNDGTDWAAVNNGLSRLKINSIAVYGNNVIAGTDSGAYLSTNNGISWNLLTQGLATQNVTSFAISGNNIYAGTLGDGIYLSTNDGINWNSFNSGLSNLNVNALSINGNLILAGTDGGVFLSADMGKNWIAKNSGLAKDNITTIVFKENNILAGTKSQGILLSTDNGTSWKQVNQGIRMVFRINAFAICGDVIYVGMDVEGIYRSTDNGSNWTGEIDGLYEYYDYAFIVTGNKIMVGTGWGCFISTINYSQSNYHWEACNNGLGDNMPNCLAVNKGILYAGTYYGVMISADYGDNWKPITNSKPGMYNVSSIVIDGNRIIAGTNNWMSAGVYLSTDNGYSWIAKNKGLTDTFVKAVAINEKNIIAGTADSGIFISSDYGENWKRTNDYNHVYSIAVKDNYVFEGQGGGLFRSTDYGETWEQMNKGSNGLGNLGLDVYSILIDSNKIYVGTGVGIYLSTDNGENWSAVFNGPVYRLWFAIAKKGENIFGGIFVRGMILSTDNGISWSEITIGLPNSTQSIHSILITDNYIFASDPGDGVYRTKLSDLGITDVKDKKIVNNEFSLFPNPCRDKLMIDLPDNISLKKIEIINMLGFKVLEFTTQEQETAINIESLPNGVYFLRLGNNSKIFVKN